MGLKKAVNVSVDGELLAKAKDEGINLSAALERTIRAEISSIEGKRWQLENAEFIRHNNEELAKNGLWSDGLRLF